MDEAQWRRAADAASKRLSRCLPPGVSRDDIHAACLVGAWKCSGRYDPSLNVSVNTWLFIGAFHEGIDWIRITLGRNQKRRIYSFDGDVVDDHQHEPGVMLAAEEEVEKILTCLDDPQDRAIARLLIEGFKKRDILRRLEIARSDAWISETVSRITRRLRENCHDH
jgi:DNA-directed RNA polymerase specialized sigma24 family protein